MQEIETQEEFNRIFKKCEDTIKQFIKTAEKTLESRKAVQQGPKPITIEEYRRRNKLIKKEEAPKIPTPIKVHTRKRGGKQVRKRKEIAETFRQLNLTTNTVDRLRLKEKIKTLRNKKL